MAYDITEALELLKKYRRSVSGQASLKAFIVKCAADALVSYPQVRSRPGKYLPCGTAGSIDVLIPVEVRRRGKHYRTSGIIREAGRKSVREIYLDIRKMQEGKGGEVCWARLAPAFLVNGLARGAHRFPAIFQRFFGTVRIDQQATQAIGPLGRHTFSVQVVGISQTLRPGQERFDIRELLDVRMNLGYYNRQDSVSQGLYDRFRKNIETGQGILVPSGWEVSRKDEV